ncbi:MAG: GNAT family N-acetyltransferase [Chloroflexi bacterium]|nr:GNAT family N-acetyltransferase [Chloroflexota bacterium]MCC6896637.1 GNAT family N-acetyltransferase [Anaerolineae bacterium]
MNDRIQILSFNPSHQQQVIDLILSIQREYGISITLADQPDLQAIPTVYQRDAGNFWVALVDGQVVGTTALLDFGGRQAALRKMFVHPDYRGKEWGVGQRLLDTLMQWAGEQGLTDVFLGTTEMFKAAHRFYEKNGFTQIPRDELPSTFPLVAVDTRFYHHPLS